MIYVGYLFMPSNLVWFARRRCAFGDRGPSKDQSIVVVVGPSVDRCATPLVGSRSCHVGTNRMIYRTILVLHDFFSMLSTRVVRFDLFKHVKFSHFSSPSQARRYGAGNERPWTISGWVRNVNHTYCKRCKVAQRYRFVRIASQCEAQYNPVVIE